MQQERVCLLGCGAARLLQWLHGPCHHIGSSALHMPAHIRRMPGMVQDPRPPLANQGAAEDHAMSCSSPGHGQEMQYTEGP